MPIVPFNLTTAGDGTDQQNYLTASVSPTPGRFQLIWIRGQHGASLQSVTPSGCGLTWTEVRSQDFGTMGRAYLFRSNGVGATTGQLTLSWSASMVRCDWIWLEFSGVETGGINGANGIVQSNSNASNGSNMSISLGAFVDPVNNAAVGGFSSANGTAPGLGSGFTSISTATYSEGSLRSEYKIGEDTSVDVTHSTFNGVVGYAVELKLATGGGGGGGQSGGKGTGGGVSGGGGNAFGKGKDKDHGKDKGGGSGPPGIIDKILVGSRSRRRRGAL